MNVPWIGSSYHFAPLSKLDDGYMDITLSRRNNIGRIGLITLLIDQDDGNYWNDDETMRQNLGIEYYKVTEYSLFPRRKGPKPERASVAETSFQDHGSEVDTKDGKSRATSPKS